MKQIRGRWYLVTGGASGIGAATARRIVHKHGKVIIVDKNAELASDLNAELNSASPGASLSFSADVTKEAELQGVQGFIAGQGVELSGLINAAGIFRQGDPLNSPLEHWDQIYSSNLRSIVMCCKTFVPPMVTRGQGAVVNIASASGVVGFSSMAAYSSMKFALIGYTQSLRSSLQGSGVKVSCICPGLVRTNILHSAELSPSLLEQLSRGLNRWGIDPGRVARAATRGLVMAPHVCDHVGFDAHLIHVSTLLFPHRASDLVGALEQRFFRPTSRE